MTRDELATFLRLNQEFHATADVIKKLLQKGMSKANVEKHIGVCSSFEILFQPHHYHLLMFANPHALAENAHVLFGEDGNDDGVVLKVPLKAFFCTDEERKRLAQESVNEFVAEFMEDQARRDRQNEAKDRETYERLKKRFEKGS